MTEQEQKIETGIKDYVEHLRTTAKVFNESAKSAGLPVELDPTKVIAAIQSGVGLDNISSYWTREDDNGIVHETQIKTAIECTKLLHTQGARCGHVVGAMQSGKTTTSLALQWAGPILYTIESKGPVYPFYIIGSQTNHEDQTLRELNHFLAYYGDLELHLIPGANVEAKTLDPMFQRAPTLKMYRTHVLRNAFKETLDAPKLDQDLVHRRVGGKGSLKQIADLTRRATAEGYRPLMIIDEPQYGASDRLVITENGTEQRECVLTQILNRIESELGSSRNDHWFIGLSATPFELNDLSRLWEVRQALTENYSGFNYFNQSPISPGTDINPPITMSLSRFAEFIHVPFMAKVAMTAYDLDKQKAFASHAKKIRYDGDQESYRRATEEALRAAIYALLDQYKKEGKTVGFCIRAFNNNTKTESFIEKLNLDSGRIEVIRYYGHDVSSVSVKRAINQRKNKDLPYLIFVTNRARMADAFPVDVRFFLDFAKKASDLNSLLQGLLGRACGYGKKSTVVMSDANAAIVDAYIRTKGGYVHKTSRHSIPVGGYRRGAPTWMIKFRDDAPDSVMKNFFKRINEEVVQKNIQKGALKLRTGRTKKGEKFRTGPVLKIAEELKLFDHVEQPDIREKLFPQIPMEFHVARRDDVVPHIQQPSASLKYSVDSEGNCRYTFRWSDRDAGARGGAPGRAKGKRDTQQHMEPTIYVEKYDPATGKSIEDKGMPEGQQKSGDWRAFMVTFPLLEPIRELQAAEIALPIQRSTYNYLLTEGEKIIRDAEEMGKKEDENK